MAHITKNEKLINAVVALIIILNTFGVPLGRLLHVPSIIFTAAPIALLFIVNCKVYSGKLNVNKTLRVYLYIVIAVTLAHVIKSFTNDSVGIGDQEIKYVIYFLAFLFAVSLVDSQNWKIVEFSFVGISAFLVIDALRNVRPVVSRGLRIYNVTNFTLLDKAYYTVILTITVVFMLTNLILKKKSTRSKKILSILCILSFSAVNLIIIQSKLFIVSLAVTGILMAVIARGSIKRNVIFILFILFFSAVSIVIIFPELVPDYIYIFINRYLGLFEAIVTKMERYVRMTSTYVHRRTIYEFAFGLCKDNPILGIGFGNYKIYAFMNSELLGDVYQTESSYLNILVEGGLLYFLAHMFFLVGMIRRLIKKLRHNKNDLILMKMLFVLITYIVLNIGNDFFNMTYWIVLSFVYKISKCEMENVKGRI